MNQEANPYSFPPPGDLARPGLLPRACSALLVGFTMLGLTAGIAHSQMDSVTVSSAQKCLGTDKTFSAKFHVDTEFDRDSDGVPDPILFAQWTLKNTPPGTVANTPVMGTDTMDVLFQLLGEDGVGIGAFTDSLASNPGEVNSSGHYEFKVSVRCLPFAHDGSPLDEGDAAVYELCGVVARQESSTMAVYSSPAEICDTGCVGIKDCTEPPPIDPFCIPFVELKREHWLIWQPPCKPRFEICIRNCDPVFSHKFRFIARSIVPPFPPPPFQLPSEPLLVSSAFPSVLGIDAASVTGNQSPLVSGQLALLGPGQEAIVAIEFPLFPNPQASPFSGLDGYRSKADFTIINDFAPSNFINVSMTPIRADLFYPLGGASSGSLGPPVLGGIGGLFPNWNSKLCLQNVPPFSPFFTLYSLQLAPQPLFGGTLLPDIFPAPLFFSGFADSQGNGSVNLLVPGGSQTQSPTIPPGINIYFQSVVIDPGVVGGITISNAVGAFTQ